MSKRDNHPHNTSGCCCCCCCQRHADCQHKHCLLYADISTGHRLYHTEAPLDPSLVHMLPQPSLLLGFWERATESKHRVWYATSTSTEAHTECLQRLKKYSRRKCLVMYALTCIYTYAYTCTQLIVFSLVPVRLQAPDASACASGAACMQCL